jgi:hypothetical protein
MFDECIAVHEGFVFQAARREMSVFSIQLMNMIMMRTETREASRSVVFFVMTIKQASYA